MDKTYVLPKLFRYAGKYKVFIILSWIFSAASGVISLLPYICIYFVARELLSSWNNPALLRADHLASYGWTAVKGIMCSFMFYAMALIFSHISAFNLMANLRIKLIRKFGELPLGFHVRNPSGKLRKIVEKNAENIENFVAHQLPDTVQAGVMPFAFVASMFYFDWHLAFVCIIPVIAGFLVLGLMLKDESGGFLESYQKALENMSNSAVEYVRGISVIKVFGQTIFSFKHFYDSITTYKKFVTQYALSMEKPMSLYIAFVHGIFFFLIPGGIIFYKFSQSKDYFILSFIFFVVFTPLAAVLLMRIMFSSSNKLITSQALSTVEALLNEKPMPQPEYPVIPESFAIEFNCVSFRYDETKQNAINNLSFKLKEGSITALVGPSGGGKTTIVNLLSRFWDVTEGRISVGGINLKDMDYSWWMDKISFVFQDVQLFKTTIAQNVAFHKPDAGEDEIKSALSLAQCDDIIEKFPDGIHTEIGSKGIYVSGGEMQRIALARAILKNSPVVLLDEATAFADPENEYRIQKALNILMRGKTVIIIAHRLSTVVGADKIFVIDHGAIKEGGTHEELMNKKGVYSKMFTKYQTSTSWKIGGKADA